MKETEERFNDATTLRPNGYRMMDALSVNIDLVSLVEQIKHEKAWEDSDRNAITVFKSSGIRIVIIALHKGAEMSKHIVNDIICLQVLEGQILFNTDKQSAALGKGRIFTLHAGIAHSLLAIEDTVFLLTLISARLEKKVTV